MARILVPNNNQINEWFEQIAPQSFDEKEIETLIIVYAPTVYPEYHVLPFKKSVSNLGNKNRIPDLIFIAKDYTDWWICEVELGEHPDSHIEEQVKAFTEANYGVDETNYICNKNTELQLNYERINKLFQDVPPRVFVIVNEPKKAWKKIISRYGAMLGVFELFRSQITGEEIFRVNGDYPSRYITQISKCNPHPILAQVFIVETPENLNLPKSGIISLIYNSCLTEWRRTDVNGQVMIRPLGKAFLEATKQYEIYLQGNSTLVIRRYDP